jgi:hypothetical protein
MQGSPAGDGLLDHRLPQQGKFRKKKKEKEEKAEDGRIFILGGEGPCAGKADADT